MDIEEARRLYQEVVDGGDPHWSNGLWAEICEAIDGRVSELEAAPEPGAPIGKSGCPCCGAELDIHHGEETGEIAVSASGGRMAELETKRDKLRLKVLGLIEERNSALEAAQKPRSMSEAEKRVAEIERGIDAARDTFDNMFVSYPDKVGLMTALFEEVHPDSKVRRSWLSEQE